MQHKAPGYLRLHSRGPILPFLYDFDTKSCGLYKGDTLVISSTPYNQQECAIPYEALVEVLLADHRALGAFIINNTDLMVLGQTFTGLQRGWKYGTDDEGFSYASMPGCGSTWHPTTEVGWIKTVTPRADLPVLPYRLAVDAQGYTSFDYKTLKHLPDAIPCGDPQLYKELIRRDADYVYMTPAGPVFAKGEVPYV